MRMNAFGVVFGGSVTCILTVVDWTYVLQDFAWLELINESRIKDGLETISEDMFELAMDRFEKESVFQCEFSADESGRTSAVDEDAACSVCGSGDTEADNNILFCDLCNIAVHQVIML